MKNNLLFLVVVPFVLAGCSFTSTPSDVVESTGINVTTGTVESGVVLDISGSVQDTDKPSYSKPIVTMVQPGLQLTTTDVIYTANNISISESNYKKYQSQFKDCISYENLGGIDYSCKEMKGFSHVYYASKLGLRVFYEYTISKTDPKYLILDGNILYSSDDHNDFIEYIKKDPKLSPDDIINTIVTPKNCKINKELADNIPAHKQSDLITYSLDGDSCRKESSNYAYTLYIFSKTETSYYYRQSIPDDSSGGGSSLSNGTQEFFVK